MTQDIAIHWFRQDLRLEDNPAFTEAAKHAKVLPIYILDDENAGDYARGAASRVWLHHSLDALNKSLGGKLAVYKGDALEILKGLIYRHNITAVYWNRCYEPWRIKRDGKIKEFLKENDVNVESMNGSLLWEPWDVKKNDGEPYKVFTPFYRKGCMGADKPRKPLDAPEKVNYQSDDESVSINSLNLLPNISWDKPITKHWDISEKGAHETFDDFLKDGLAHYKEGRNLPDKPYVSRMSPYLHFGLVSPNQLWHKVRAKGNNENIDHFCSELGWREFSYTQLYYNSDLPKKNLQKKFDKFPWSHSKELLEVWQKGQTGVPMVDAGMRQLWQTGYMHNRVRMIVGSFLVKNLRLHWHSGERWFWDTLVDADLANNSTSWQWIGGCGADAAPYFRIFNCVTQGQKFDPDGGYVREFVPEIADLPNKYLFNPWEAPESVLKEAGVELGKTYPKPIVDLKKSREEALEAFKSLKD